MNIIQRVQAPTPKFFRILRSVGLALSAASAIVIASPIALPAVVVTIAGYLAVGGAVATAVSQTAVEGDDGSTARGGSNGGGTTIESPDIGG